MNPQPTFEHALKERESQLLQERIAKLDEQEKQALRDDAQELLLEQSKKPDVSVLPTLKIADIEPTIPTVNINQISFGSIPITCVSAPTNGVTYFRALISTESLDAALRPYVPLFCEIATQMGAGDMDYRQLSQKIELKTGGLAVGEHASQHFSSTDRFEQGVMLGSKCLDRNISEMFGLWKDIFNRIRLDDLEQFGVLVKQNAAELAASLAGTNAAELRWFKL